MSTKLHVVQASPCVNRQQSSSHSKTVEKTATGQRKNEASENSCRETKCSVKNAPNSSSMKTSQHSSYKCMTESCETAGECFPSVSTPRAMISFRPGEDSKYKHNQQPTSSQRSSLTGAHEVEESSSLDDQIIHTTQKSEVEDRGMYEGRKQAEDMTKKHSTSEKVVPIEMGSVLSKTAILTSGLKTHSPCSEPQHALKDVTCSPVVISSPRTNQTLHNTVIQYSPQTTGDRKDQVSEVLQVLTKPYVDHQQTSTYSKTVEKTATGQRETVESGKSSRDVQQSMQKTPNSDSMKRSQHNYYQTTSQSSETSGGGLRPTDAQEVIKIKPVKELNNHNIQHTIKKQTNLLDHSSSLGEQHFQTAPKVAPKAREIFEEKNGTQDVRKKNINSEKTVPIEMEVVSSAQTPSISSFTQENHNQLSESQHLWKTVHCNDSPVTRNNLQKNASHFAQQIVNDKKHQASAAPHESLNPHVDRQQTSTHFKTVEKTANGEQETEESEKRTQEVQHSMQTAHGSSSTKTSHHSSYQTMSQSSETSSNDFRPANSQTPIHLETLEEMNCCRNQQESDNRTNTANQSSYLDKQIVQTAPKSVKKDRDMFQEKTQTEEVIKKDVTSEKILPIEMEPVSSKPAPVRSTSTKKNHNQRSESQHRWQDGACSPDVTSSPETKQGVSEFSRQTIDGKRDGVSALPEALRKPFDDHEQTSIHSKTVEKTATGKRETEESEKSHRVVQHLVQKTPHSNSMKMSQHRSFQTMSQCLETSNGGFQQVDTRAAINIEPLENFNSRNIHKESKNQTKIVGQPASLDELIVETAPTLVKEAREVLEEKKGTEDVTKKHITSDKIVPIEIALVSGNPVPMKFVMTQSNHRQCSDMQQVGNDLLCNPIATSPPENRQISHTSNIMSHVSGSSETCTSNETNIPVASISQKEYAALKSPPKSRVVHPSSRVPSEACGVTTPDSLQQQQCLESQIQHAQNTLTRELSEPVSSMAQKNTERTLQKSRFEKSVSSSGEEHVIPIAIPDAPLVSQIVAAPIGAATAMPCIDRQETLSHSKEHHISGNTMTETDSSQKSAYSMCCSGTMSASKPQVKPAAVLNSGEACKPTSETMSVAENKLDKASNIWQPAPTPHPITSQTDSVTQESTFQHTTEQDASQQNASARLPTTGVQTCHLQMQAGASKLTPLENERSQDLSQCSNQKSFIEEWEKDDKSNHYQSMSYSSGGNLEVFDKDGRRVRREKQESETKKSQKQSETFDTEEIRCGGKKCRVHKTVKTTTEHEVTESCEMESSMS